MLMDLLWVFGELISQITLAGLYSRSGTVWDRHIFTILRSTSGIACPERQATETC